MLYSHLKAICRFICPVGCSSGMQMNLKSFKTCSDSSSFHRSLHSPSLHQRESSLGPPSSSWSARIRRLLPPNTLEILTCMKLPSRPSNLSNFQKLAIYLCTSTLFNVCVLSSKSVSTPCFCGPGEAFTLRNTQVLARTMRIQFRNNQQFQTTVYSI